MFSKGTEWIRADFHLHTRIDKEFIYSGESDRFVSDYVEKLVTENIRLGVITNHNKFNLGEYKAIKRKANKQDIIILPGVELSVKEGGNGIHCLIIFKDGDWIKGNKEEINNFLEEVFKGIPNREHENTRCNFDLPKVIEVLETYNKEFFILMAHIEQKSGFLKECEGGLITSLSSKPEFQRRVLGFQKGRTRDEMLQLEQWMGYRLPYIEGSDCKSIEQIGKGKHSYIKIGDNNFESLVLALKDFENRISLESQKTNHGYIQSVEFIGGKLNKEKIEFSSELNCLIGIRGSGKSSVIEAIRYALDIDPSNSDKLYKREVVENLLESGGQIILELKDNFGEKYRIKRLLKEKPHIFDKDDQLVGARIETILNAPLYFGQKDLSNMDNGFELDLLDKLVGKRNKQFKEQLLRIENNLSDKIKKYIEIESEINTVSELRDNLADIMHKIKTFEEKGLSGKLSKQVNYHRDNRTIKESLELTRSFIKTLQKILSLKEVNELTDLKSYQSQEVPELFQKLTSEINNVLKFTDKIQELIKELENSTVEIEIISKEMQKTIDSQEEEFAEIKREINIPNLNPDDFAKLKANEERINSQIEMIQRQHEEKQLVKNSIIELIEQSNQILHEELQEYIAEITDINNSQESLKLNITFKGDRDFFVEKLKDTFKGSGINNNSYEKLSKEFQDFPSLISDVLLFDSKVTAQVVSSQQLDKLKLKLNENFDSILRISTPNKIQINYHGKPLAKHSIGQRASALVLFILSQKDNNLIMIDQPEDDLDNQVIYNEIIKEVKIRKSDAQFIFATHNANIPVLGDSEQIITVTYEEEKITVETGSIDNTEIQKSIVDIMEGGQEAFSKRTEIYNLWKRQ